MVKSKAFEYSSLRGADGGWRDWIIVYLAFHLATQNIQSSMALDPHSNNKEVWAPKSFLDLNGEWDNKNNANHFVTYDWVIVCTARA